MHQKSTNYQTRFFCRAGSAARHAIATAAVAVACLVSDSAPAAAATYTLTADPLGQEVVDGYGNNAEASHFYRGIDPSGYGDVATYGSIYHYGAGYGDLVSAFWNSNDGGHGEIRIEANDPSKLVTLLSFEMAGWVFDQNAEWTLFDLSWNQIASGGGIAPAVGHLTPTPNAGAVGGLIFQWGDDAWDVGLANLTYSVDAAPTAPVPLPASAVLLVAGLAAMARVAKRR